MNFKRNLALTAATTLFAVIASTPSWAGGFNIPTGAPPSPIPVDAAPFAEDMLLFEEFGNQSIPSVACAGCTPMPAVQSCKLAPATQDIDKFLSQAIAGPGTMMPEKYADRTQQNPWLASVRSCVSDTITTSPADGRPSGEWFSHQRWNEFQPKFYFQSAQTGARPNSGFRDNWQRHKFAIGEFGPGGLYHGNNSNANSGVRFNSHFAYQDPNSVWTFDGTMPPKLLMARYGNPVLFRHFNMLPIDEAANNGFGSHTITTHEHNGHNPAESDGFAAAYFFPGQYYDYRWPMVLAGHDTINTNASNPRAAFPEEDADVNTRIPGDWRETMSTHWFHDHMLDHTAENVYKGNAAMMNYYSAVDPGREAFNCNYTDSSNPNMCFPSGTALKWGNRDYDVNLVIADKAWDAKGQLYFNIFNTDGFLGDQVLVNWTWKPVLKVRPRRYRFRILNGAVSRYFRLAVVTEAGQRMPFYMIANDGNILKYAVAFPNSQSQELPTQGIAERYDIVVDFQGLAQGTKLYLVNTMEHQDGKGPSRIVPLVDIISGKYVGDPAVGKILQFKVDDTNYPRATEDKSMKPSDYVEGNPGNRTMTEMPSLTATDLAGVKVRDFEFGRSSGSDNKPWTIKTDGGQGLNADMHRVSADPTKGTLEVWRLKNGGSGWSHPVHIHFEEGRVLSRDGAPPPVWEKYARKDVYRIGSPSTGSSTTVELALRIRDFAGTYMEHCHNTQHEDHAMLLRWDSVNPGQTVMIPMPLESWEGTKYEDSFRLIK